MLSMKVVAPQSESSPRVTARATADPKTGNTSWLMSWIGQQRHQAARTRPH